MVRRKRPTFSGSYKNGGHIYSYMFGPAIVAHLEHVTPFIHALFGGATAGNGSSSTTALAMALGGGQDANAGKHYAVRLVQADCLLYSVPRGYGQEKRPRLYAYRDSLLWSGAL